MIYIQALARGRGGLKYYSYWTGGIKLRTKTAVKEAIGLKLRVLRKDMIMKSVEKYNYKTKEFEKVK